MKLDPFSGPGSTPSRRRFWNDARKAVLALQKVAGRNVTVDEHPGKGSVINVADTSARRPPTSGGSPTQAGACCQNNGDCDVLTESECDGAGGNWQGPGTNCDDIECVGACCEVDGACTDGVTPDTCEEGGGTFQDFQSTCDDPDIDCPTDTGACCKDGVCTQETSAHCASIGGTYLGNGTPCRDNTCDCACGFSAFDGSGRKFLRYHRTISGSSSREESNNCPEPNGSVSVTASCAATFEQHYAADCSLVTDTDTSSSSHTVAVDGVTTDSCSRADIECFCGSIAPHNQCSSFIDGFVTCGGCSSPPPSTTVDTAASTKVTTVNFSSSSCSGSCVACDGCVDTCAISGSYVVTETLSEECLPI